MSLGSKNMYLITPFFLWHFSGYPVKMMRFRMTLSGVGGMTMPGAAMISS